MTFKEDTINKQKVIQKFDSLSSGFSEREYSNLNEYMQRRARLAINWGKRLEPEESESNF